VACAAPTSTTSAKSASSLKSSSTADGQLPRTAGNARGTPSCNKTNTAVVGCMCRVSHTQAAPRECCGQPCAWPKMRCVCVCVSLSLSLCVCVCVAPAGGIDSRRGEQFEQTSCAHNTCTMQGDMSTQHMHDARRYEPQRHPPALHFARGPY
jgi:hypothetical protein